MEEQEWKEGLSQVTLKAAWAQALLSYLAS